MRVWVRGQERLTLYSCLTMQCCGSHNYLSACELADYLRVDTLVEHRFLQVQLLSEPTLFFLRGWHKARDHKILGMFGVFLGGFVGRALADTIPPGATLGIATGLRIIIAITWLVVGRSRKV
jgi:hypothetical protein